MHKTAIRIDEDAAAAAKAILGTTTLTDTVNAALREIVNADRSSRLFERLRTGKGMDLHLLEKAGAAWR